MVNPNDLYHVYMIMKSRKINDFVGNEMIFSMAEMPGMDKYCFDILKKHDLAHPLKLFREYQLMSRFRVNMLKRLDKFNKYLLNIGMKSEKRKIISIVMEAKRVHYKTLKVTKNLSCKIIEDYF